MKDATDRRLKAVRWSKFAIGALAITSISSSALAQAPWAEELALQIKALRDCDVALLAQVLERESNGVTFVMAKVHCEDGRAFDALKPGRDELFKFTECGRPNERDC